MKLLVKLFLEDRDRYVLGPGRVELLRSLEELGSLRKAAQKLSMSYRWAWGRLKNLEEALGIPLLIHEPESSGRAKVLTAEARELLIWYNAVEKEMADVFAKASAKCPGFLRRPASDPAKASGKK
jgi:molybdate transport system regulatory protein